MDRNKIPHDPHHLGVLLGASKMISVPMVCSDQTVHRSCVKVSTTAKRIESSFHLSLVTMKYHWVRPKWFLSLLYVCRKLCTYLTPTQTLSINGPKRDSTWPKLPWSYVGSAQNDFWACGMFGTKRAPILRHVSTLSKWTKSSFHMSLII
jgi:hypothetical protein